MKYLNICRARELFAVALVAVSTTCCTLYEDVEIGATHPPQVENESLIVPDWDDKPTQQ